MKQKKDSKQRFYQLTKGVFYLLIVGYFVYLLGFSIQKNISTNEEIRSLKQEISKLESDIATIKNLLVYYNTDSFKELEARRRLGMKKNGEKVVLTPTSKERNLKAEDESRIAKPSGDTTPNIEKWWRYITKGAGE